MKKVLLGAVLAAVAMGCASSEKQQQGTSDALTSQYAKYQIIDQEFDNLSIPNDNYDRVAPYEDQVNGSSYIQSVSSSRTTGKKPARTDKVQKTVVDGNGNPLPADAAAPVTDQEALPDETF